MSSQTKKILCGLGVFALLCAVTVPAWAGTSTGMPWEGAMETIMNFFTGTFAKVGGVIAIVVLGVSFAFAEGSGGTRRLIGVFFGLALAFSAVTWGLDFLGFKDSGLADEYQQQTNQMQVTPENAQQANQAIDSQKDQPDVKAPNDSTVTDQPVAVPQDQPVESPAKDQSNVQSNIQDQNLTITKKAPTYTDRILRKPVKDHQPVED